ncbi:UNC-6/NTR/C345C module [Dictyocaulus viviparus]|uniref:UNC-6/NTR/C345C module n=1 Tax=Dictyocaulus viviparus TaxID=29172 RepID=A0A0D8Y7Z5_DICVI|nr:UNC-6/NTR/C345C module [Dictyocaulus viviparus]
MKLLIVLVTYVAICNACSCRTFDSPKEAFCSSGFVTHVKVIAKNDPNNGTSNYADITYKVSIFCVYKKPTETKKLTNKIVTASNSAACGIELEIGEEYLLGGSIDAKGVQGSYLCGIVQKWNTVSAKDRSALNQYKC